MINYKDISNCLKSLGVEKGDICLFHSSFKSLGEVDGGAEAVVRGFDNAVGETGTVVVPTLCSEDFFNSYKNWHLDKKSDVGYLTEYFRKLPDAIRSDHATHSVAARGRLAHELTFEHAAYGPHLCPFGEYAFAESSPWVKMYKMGAKIVFIGVTMKYNTMKHLVEAIVTETLLSGISNPQKREEMNARLQTFDNRWNGVWLYYKSDIMQEHLDSLGLVRHAKCGDAELICVDAQKTNDAAISELLNNPEKWYADDRLQWINECKKQAR